MNMGKIDRSVQLNSPESSKLDGPGQSQPENATILLGYRKITNISQMDVSSLPKSLKDTTLATNSKASRFTHVTIKTDKTHYKVAIGALAHALDVSKIKVIFTAIFGDLNKLINENIKKSQSDDKNATLKEFVDKNNMAGLAKELVNPHVNPREFKTEFKSALSTLQTLRITDDQKKQLFDRLLEEVPFHEKENFLLKNREGLVSFFGAKTFNPPVQLILDNHIKALIKISTPEKFFDQLNQIPRELDSQYFNEKLSEKLGAKGTLQVIKDIVSHEFANQPPNTVLRGSKNSDAFISHFLSTQLKEALADGEFAKLLDLPAENRKLPELLFERLGTKTHFSEDLVEYGEHLTREANRYTGATQTTGLDFLMKSIKLRGVGPLILNHFVEKSQGRSSEDQNKALLRATSIINAFTDYGDVRKKDVQTFLFQLGGHLGDEIDIEEKVTAEQKELEEKAEEDVKGFYKYIASGPSPHEVSDDILESNNSKSPKEKAAIITAQNTQWRNLKEEEREAILARIPDFKEKHGIVA